MRAFFPGSVALLGYSTRPGEIAETKSSLSYGALTRSAQTGSPMSRIWPGTQPRTRQGFSPASSFPQALWGIHHSLDLFPRLLNYLPGLILQEGLGCVGILLSGLGIHSRKWFWDRKTRIIYLKNPIQESTQE